MQGITKKTIKSYDETAKSYAENTEALEPPQVVARETFFSLVKPGSEILDICCGPGRDAKLFTSKGYRVTGVDLSDELLRLAKRTAPEARFLKMDMADLTLPPASFDAVWFNAGILHAEKKDAPAILQGVYRIMRPDAILYINVKQGEGEGLVDDARYGGAQKYFAFYSEPEFRALLKAAHFKVLSANTPDLKAKHHTHPWFEFYCRKV